MIRLLRDNPRFRLLWSAQVVTALGDWMNRIAVLSLITGLGGATGKVGLAYALEYVLRMLPTALWSPLAGPLADRLPRRFLMVASDLVRAGIVLCFLFVDEPGELGLLYALIFAQMSLSIFFESARSGAIPTTVRREDLYSAYALSGLTWSTMLAVGAMLGGLLVEVIGVRAVFVCDAASYVLSALLLGRLVLPPVTVHPEAFRLSDVLLLTDLRRGLAHVRALGIAPILLSKLLWGPAGGYLVLLPLIAMRWQSGGAGGDLAESGAEIGLLFFARGVGTGLGPVLARRLFGEGDAVLLRQCWGGMLVGAFGYSLLPLAPNLEVAALCVVLAHLGGSAQWVGSTAYWQRRIDDAFRGRVFATEFLGMTVSFSIFSAITGLHYDYGGTDLDRTILLLVALTVAGGLLAALLFRRLPRGGEVPGGTSERPA